MQANLIRNIEDHKNLLIVMGSRFFRVIGAEVIREVGGIAYDGDLFAFLVEFDAPKVFGPDESGVRLIAGVTV